MSRFGVLLDIDGVLCNPSGLMLGAAEFVDELVKKNIPFMCLSNNSLKKRSEMSQHLKDLGLAVKTEQIYTSAMATARFLAQQKKNARVYVLGSGGLLTALEKNNLMIVEDKPDYVIVGEGRDYSLEVVDQAIKFLNEGARLVTVNMDNQRSTAFGLRSGCCSIVKLLEDETNKKALNLGKPSPLMLRSARKLLGMRASFTVMIGDHMDNDIYGGIQLGYYSIMVMSGRASAEEMKNYSFMPDKVIGSLGELSVTELETIIDDKPIDEDYLITFG
ncbi:HAD-IIA family hydrolase [Lentisphaera profundi]|uniref:HAD-IIA family hydrolase n=1 Tax=Lentisphaera profundi TaxID=1658616 RepID=A0ABY7VXI5_9BACT|nr:HAD-IIA family hydrolase [Lentisphaera profundi]WDE97496.1 HAD-IIA family hydrolase [Lentisphaera profundi]